MNITESSSKAISAKYRHLHPSHLGVVDLNTTSNSDVGMSGSIVPFVKLYDKFYFNEDREPCTAKYDYVIGLTKLIKENKKQLGAITPPLKKDISFNKWILTEGGYDKEFISLPIKIVEKEATIIPD